MRQVQRHGWAKLTSGSSVLRECRCMSQARLQLTAATATAELLQRVSLPHDSFEIVTHGSGVQLREPLSFSADQYLAALKTREMGRLLLAAARLPSTQELMKEHSTALPPGTVVLADQQSAGKGRGANSWISPPGCLMFTTSRRLRVPGTAAPFLNYVVCLAIVRAVQNLALSVGAVQPAGQGGSGGPPLLRIKWPNDLYFRGLKVGGALLHSTWRSPCFHLTTGIGLNVTNREPTTCIADILAAASADSSSSLLPGAGSSTPVSALPSATEAVVGREEVLAEVMLQLEACLDVFEQHGSFEALKDEYMQAWLHTGQQLQLEGQPNQDGPSLVTVAGLSSSGFLLAQDSSGQRYELTPDGNSLDMMQGMIRRKLPS